MLLRKSKNRLSDFIKSKKDYLIVPLLTVIYFYPMISYAETIGTQEIAFTIPNTNRDLVAEIYFPIHNTQALKTIDYGIWERRAFIKDAPLPRLPKQYPLLIFSHGWQGDRFGHSWIAERLVEEGYIVAMIDHTHNTSYDHNDLFVYTSMWQRPIDMSALLTYLLEHSEWRKVIDKDKVVAGGFSLGGLTALWLAGIQGNVETFKQAMNNHYSRWNDWPKSAKDKALKVDWHQAAKSYYDPRIKAVFAIAPDLGEAFTEEGIKHVKVPALIIVGDKDKVTSSDKNACFYASNISNSTFFLVKGAEHFSFMNNCSKVGKHIAANLCHDSGDIRMRIHNETATKIIAFLTASLMHR